jgi:hypothetical protein
VHTTFPFTFRGQESSVTVEFDRNDNRDRWGFGALELPWPSSLAAGRPVVRARVSAPLEGYAAVMGWIQVVRLHVAETSTSLVAGGEKAPPGDHAWVDGPPQLRGLGVPFVSFGCHRPQRRRATARSRRARPWRQICGADMEHRWSRAGANGGKTTSLTERSSAGEPRASALIATRGREFEPPSLQLFTPRLWPRSCAAGTRASRP